MKASRKLRIYLADLAYFSKNQKLTTIPLNIGYIAAYAYKQFGDDIEITLFKSPDRLLEKSRIFPPDILGVSCYYWNHHLSALASKNIKKINPDCRVFVGGPSVDIDDVQQARLFQSYEGLCDVLVLNEGELGFSNFLNVILASGFDKAFMKPVDGCVYFQGDTRLAGKDVGLSLDLTSLPSPIISGLLDVFLTVDYLPIIQTSRMCPYSCSYCCSGKLKGKLRAFPEYIVEEELKILARAYMPYPHRMLYITDENFGILKRDLGIARNISKVRRAIGWPKQVFTYFDKNFTGNLKETILELGDMNSGGMSVPFQTLNEDALTVIKRKNIVDADVDKMIAWANENKIKTSSEFIFGLPCESKASFHESMERVLRKKIDAVVVNNLFLVQGIELNRVDERERFGIKTKFRPSYGSEYRMYNNEFVCEVEEVVVSTPQFTFNDYLDVRKTLLLIYATNGIGFFKQVINYLIDKKIPIMPFYDRIMSPAADDCLFEGKAEFVDDFINDAKRELFDSFEDVSNYLQRQYTQNGNEVGNPTRLNVLYSSRLIYKEQWFSDLVLHILKDQLGDDPILGELVQFSVSEWVDILNPRKTAETTVSGVCVNYLGIHGMVAEAKRYRITMCPSEEQILKLESYNAQVSDAGNLLYYYNALDVIQPRKSLRFEGYKVEPL